MNLKKYVKLAVQAAAAAMVGAASFTAAPAVAAANPTDVFATFYDLGDVPLRYGSIANQYGKAHIEDGHMAQVTRVGWSNMILDIEHVFHDGKCGKPINGKITCNVSGGLHGGYSSMKVVYTENTNGMPDGRPKGIITAYYP
ncbi:hypothetical protein GCM10017673_35210 [Streptosporangium violaceochromogenes]|nr:hypothetical protein GCM10017673_35210 [Streptosporangium violaceochromogenes]